MKKMLFLLFSIVLFVFISQVDVKANSLDSTIEILEKGIGNDSYLANDGYEIVSGSVNWNEVGNYYVTYIDDYGSILKKEYRIIDDENDTYFIENNQFREVENRNLFNFEDIYHINSNSYYVISNYQIENPTAQDQELVCISYFEDDILLWDYTYSKYSRYNFATLNNDNLIVCAQVYNENNGYIKSIVLFEITKERRIINVKEVSCNYSCFARGLYLYDGYIYLVTNTSGNDLDYKNIKQNKINQIVIFKINYTNFNIVSHYLLDYRDDFIVLDCCFFNNKMTISVSFPYGKEENGINYTNCIYELNTMFDYEKKYYYNLINFDYKGHVITNNDVCIYGINHNINDYCIDILYLNDSVINKNILLDLDEGYYINDLKLVNIDGDNIYFNINSKINNFGFNLGYVCVNKNNGCKYFYNFEESNYMIKFNNLNNNLIRIYYRNGKIVYDQSRLINIQSYNYNTSNYTKKIKTVNINGVGLVPNNYIENTNYEVFGKYYDVVKFVDFNNQKIFLKNEIYVSHNANVNHKEKYQKGFIVTFNGVGLLNGNEINSNYKIDDIGKYLLVIKGENEEEVAIDFEIKDFVNHNDVKKQSDLIIKQASIYSGTVNNEDLLSYDNNLIKIDNFDKVIPICLSILSLGILSFILMRKKI